MVTKLGQIVYKIFKNSYFPPIALIWPCAMLHEIVQLPLFLNISKSSTICRHLDNIILTSFPGMVIHKLRYVFAPEQSLQMWNDGNIMKNLLRKLFCYFICTISTYMTFQTFCCKFMLIIIYNMVIGACMNCSILHSNFFHDVR